VRSTAAVPPDEAGEGAFDAELGAGVAPAMRVVGLGDVGEHALDDDPLLGVPG
jgi:hypothetical protein